MSRTTTEIGTPQFAALAATITQLLGKNFDQLNPHMVQQRMQAGRHDKLTAKILAAFEPDAEDWIDVYNELYQACGMFFDIGSKLREIIRREFRPGWWPVLVQPGIGQDILWACDGAIGIYIDPAIREDVDRAINARRGALTEKSTSYVTWVRAEKNVKTADPDDDSVEHVSLLEWMVLSYALNSLTREHLDDIAVNGTLMKANGGLVRAYYNQNHPNHPLRIEPYNPKVCKAMPRERFVLPRP